MDHVKDMDHVETGDQIKMSIIYQMEHNYKLHGKIWLIYTI